MSGLPVPAECVGITLYKNFGDDNYRGTERVVFKDRNGLETTLRRAAISGKIEIGSNIEAWRLLRRSARRRGEHRDSRQPRR
jgi:hypothetical protein